MKKNKKSRRGWSEHSVSRRLRHVYTDDTVLFIQPVRALAEQAHDEQKVPPHYC